MQKQYIIEDLHSIEPVLTFFPNDKEVEKYIGKLKQLFMCFFIVGYSYSQKKRENKKSKAN